MAGQTLAADGGLGDITKLLDLVKDQKSSSSTSTNISKEGVTQQINDILQGTSGLAAVAGAQKSAGLYNSSTNTQLTNDLLARASAQVAAKNATTTTSNVKKASVSKNNIEQLLAIQSLKGIIGSDTVKAGAKSVYGSIADELGIATGANDTATANALSSVSGVGPGAQVGDFTTLESSLAGGTDINAGSVEALANAVSGTSTAAAAGGDTSVAGLEALDSAAAAGTGATATQVASFGAGTEAGATGAAADFFGADTAATAVGGGTAAGVGAAGATDAAGLAAADSAAAGAGEGAGLGAAGEVGAGALGLIGAAAIPLIGGAIKAFKSGDINDVGDVYGQFGHWVGDRLQSTGDAIGQAAKDVTGWIVCTELLRQGKFNRRHYAAGLKVFESYPKHLLCGYYIWANPLVSYIRRNPNSWITNAVRHLFAQRAEYLAARAGVSGASDTVYGQSISTLMFGFCWTLGHALNIWAEFKGRKQHGRN